MRNYGWNKNKGPEEKNMSWLQNIMKTHFLKKKLIRLLGKKNTSIKEAIGKQGKKEIGLDFPF